MWRTKEKVLVPIIYAAQASKILGFKAQLGPSWGKGVPLISTKKAANEIEHFEHLGVWVDF